MASWVGGQVVAGIEPHEFGILVRLRANEAEEELGGAFRKHGVELRNVARSVGEIAIQDLLSEDITEILVPLLRLGATKRSPVSWSAAHGNLQALEGVYADDDRGQQRVQDRLQGFVRELRAEMRGSTPKTDLAHHFAKQTLHFVGETNVRRAIPAYQRQLDFERVWTGFCQLLAESAKGVATWSSALDRYEGLGQTSLMTIHKSKGLEFHTMIFYGLDSDTWWSLTPHQSEELNAFFVAFTRARQRAFFTRCHARGHRVAWIEDLLAPVGMARVPGPLANAPVDGTCGQ